MKTLALTLLLAPLFAFAGNGGGYNGPDTQPVSIPLNLDHGISEETLAKAFGVCMAKGDAKRKIEPWFYGIARQAGLNTAALPYNCDDPTLTFKMRPCGAIRWASNIPTPLTHEKLKAHEKGPGDIIPIADIAAFRVPVDSSYSDVQVSLSRYGLTVKTDATQNAELRLDFVNFALPYFHYQSVTEDAMYDDLGRVSYSKAILNGLSIVVQPDYDQDRYAINPDTRHPTKIRYNLKDAVSCLQSELRAAGN